MFLHDAEAGVEHQGGRPDAVVAVRSLLVTRFLAVIRPSAVLLDELFGRLQRTQQLIGSNKYNIQFAALILSCSPIG